MQWGSSIFKDEKVLTGQKTTKKSPDAIEGELKVVPFLKLHSFQWVRLTSPTWCRYNSKVQQLKKQENALNVNKNKRANICKPVFKDSSYKRSEQKLNHV